MYIGVSGKMIKEEVWAFYILTMEIYIRELGQMIKGMVLVIYYIRMGVNI
jgi:hypothetical protein